MCLVKKKSENIKSGAGFTITEMLIAIAIFSLLTGAVLVNFRQGERNEQLKQASLKLAQDLRTAQSYALAGKFLKRCSGDSFKTSCETDGQCLIVGGVCTNKVPAGGFGTNIQIGVYYVFADITQNGIFDLDDGAEVTRENIGFNSISINKYKRGSTVLDLTNPIDITFSVPTGTVRVCIASGTCTDINDSTVTFLVESTFSSSCRKVTVNKFSGQVSEQGDTDCDLITDT